MSGYVFEYCYCLENIRLPSNLKHINSNVFSSCFSLRNVWLPDGLLSVGTYAFQNCYSMQSIKIPDSVTSINGDAFGNCYSLQSATYSGNFASAKSGVYLFSQAEMLTLLDWRGSRWSKFAINGSSGIKNRLGSAGNIPGCDVPLLLDFENCDWSGAAPQLDVSNTMMNGEQLNALFTRLATSGKFSGKTINITGCDGAGSCDKTIITNAGGIVTG